MIESGSQGGVSDRKTPNILLAFGQGAPTTSRSRRNTPDFAWRTAAEVVSKSAATADTGVPSTATRQNICQCRSENSHRVVCTACWKRNLSSCFESSGFGSSQIRSGSWFSQKTASEPPCAGLQIADPEKVGDLSVCDPAQPAAEAVVGRFLLHEVWKIPGHAAEHLLRHVGDVRLAKAFADGTSAAPPGEHRGTRTRSTPRRAARSPASSDSDVTTPARIILRVDPSTAGVTLATLLSSRRAMLMLGLLRRKSYRRMGH